MGGVGGSQARTDRSCSAQSGTTATVQIKAGKIMTRESDSEKEEEALDLGGAKDPGVKCYG